jgi:transposase InsO family protein
MTITSTPAAAWQELQLDICGEFKAAPRHQRFAIVLIDKFSRWPEVSLVESVTTKVIIDFLDVIWTRWGIPESITTDNGPQFGREFDDYLSSRAIEHKRTAVYCPEQNGNVERFNRTLGEGITAHRIAGWSFAKSVREVVAAYRATPSDVTGSSPHELMTGRPMRTPLRALRPQSDTAGTSATQERINAAKRRSKGNTDRRRGAAPARSATIKNGSWVWISRPVPSGKLEPKLIGPFRVCRRLHTTVILENGKRWHLRRCVLAAPGIYESRSDADFGDGDGAWSTDLMEPPAERDDGPAERPPAPEPGPRRSNRVRRPPTRYPD